MKTLYIIGDLDIAGAERMLQKLVVEHKRQGQTSVVITLRDGGPIIEELRTEGIEVIVCSIHPRRPSPFSFLKLRSLVKKIKPDLVSAWMYHSCLASLVTPKNIPLIWCIRQSLPNIKNERPFTQIVIRVCKYFSARPQAIVFNSQTSLQQHRAFGFRNGQMHVIPNGFETERFKPSKEKTLKLREKLKLTSEDFIFGHISRFHPVKGIDILLEAFSEIALQKKNAHLVLVGAGLNSDTDLIRDFQNKFPNQIHALGIQSDTSVFMPAFDAFVLSSKFNEGFPNVLGEAMLCELPCVGTDLGEVRSLLVDTGIVVAPNSVSTLRTGLMSVLEMPHERRHELGKSGRRKIEENYSLQATGSRYIKFYESLVRDR